MRTRLARAVAATAILIAGLAGFGQPASALSPNEKFVVAFFEDFMVRGPSSDEMTLWTTYLGSNTHQSMATALLEGDEFAQLWAIGTRYYYLHDVEVEDPSFSSDVSALRSSGDFVATEISVLANTPYFALHASNNNDYVEALYSDVLLRPSDSSGLSYWVGRLNAGTSTRAQVANAFIRTNESANRRVAGTSGATSCAATELTNEDSLPSGSYCIVLGRIADSSGYSYWSGQLAGSSQLPDLWASLAGSTEYFNHAQQ